MTFAPAPVHRRSVLHGRELPWLLAAGLFVIVVVLLLRYDVFGSSSTTSGTHGSGIAATQPRALAPFSSVELAGSNVVTISIGGTQSVVVHADSNLIKQVTTRVEGGRLIVANRGSFTTKVPMRVGVTMPALAALTLSGSGIITVDSVDADALTLMLSGSGVLRASGTVGRLDVSLAGSGDAQLDGLAARDVHAVVTGSGRILVHPTSSLDASVPGTGAIVYTGDPPHVTTSITGVGAVIRG